MPDVLHSTMADGSHTLDIASTEICGDAAWSDWATKSALFAVLYGVLVPLLVLVGCWRYHKLTSNRQDDSTDETGQLKRSSSKALRDTLSKQYTEGGMSSSSYTTAMLAGMCDPCVFELLCDRYKPELWWWHLVCEIHARAPHACMRCQVTYLC